MNQEFRTTRGEYSSEKGRYRDSCYEISNSWSDSMVGEEIGYVLGVEDERRRFREKMRDIIVKLKARGYSLIDIAEDTGYTLEEISVM